MWRRAVATVLGACFVGKPQAGVFSTNLPEMPPLRTWASLRYVHDFLFAELGGTGFARQKLVDLDLKETPTAGYGLMHMKIGLTHHKLNASLVVDNLLNRYYYEHCPTIVIPLVPA